jgi:hypothetical protein
VFVVAGGVHIVLGSNALLMLHACGPSLQANRVANDCVLSWSVAHWIVA